MADLRKAALSIRVRGPAAAAGPGLFLTIPLCRGPVPPLASSRARAQLPAAVQIPDRATPASTMPALHSLPLVPVPAEPPGRVLPSFVVGQDGQGRWVALECHGLGGGYFRSREAAVHYAATETRRRPGAVRIAAGPLAVAL